MIKAVPILTVSPFAVRAIIVPLLAGIGLCCGDLPKAGAIPITYTFTAQGSGKLGTNLFTSAVFTISATVDLNPSLISQYGNNPSEYYIPCTSASVLVENTLTAGSFSGSGSFTDVGNKIGVFVVNTPGLSLNNNVPNAKVIISSLSQNLAILMDASTQFVNYSLNQAEAPVYGTTIFNRSQFNTSAGNFSLTSASNVNFMAVIDYPRVAAAVPETSPTLAYLLLSLTAMGGIAAVKSSKQHLT